MKYPIKTLFLFAAFAFCLQAQSFRTLDYLKSISGKKTVSGQHNREPNSQPSKWTDQIHSVTGKYPGLWSGDFLFEADNIANRWTMIYEAKKEWDSGSIVQLMLHTCPPTQAEPCPWDGGVLSSLTDSQWTELITDGSTLNRNWKKRLDDIAVYLQYLKDNGVEVLFRPLHEMNQGSFWWGGRPGPNGTRKLYQITHDYLTNVKELNNLIWVWDVQDMSWNFQDYNPGDKYWDIMAFDVYADGYNKKWYDYVLTIAGNKPIAIGECEKLPTAALLAQQPRWVFFMAWAELVFSGNTTQDIVSLYSSPNVVNRDNLPDLKMQCAYSSISHLPGKIEAESFDKCGEGVSYHDMDAANTGGAYRTGEGIDIESCSEGGYDITNIKKGEWQAYTVQIDSAGSYYFDVRIAAADSGKTLHIEMDGSDITGQVKIPNTGGLQNWQTVTVTSSLLTKGKKSMIIYMDGDGFNLDYLNIRIANLQPKVNIVSPASGKVFVAPADVPLSVSAQDTDGSIKKIEYYQGVEEIGESWAAPFALTWSGVSAGSYYITAAAVDNGGLKVYSDPVDITVVNPQAPFLSKPYDIPGKIEVENYDLGGEGYAYHDLTKGNKFSVYRTDDVDIETCTDTGGGYSLGDFQAGEWVEYTVNVTKTASYDIEFRVATSMTGTGISLDVDGLPLTGNIQVPNTGAWQNWQSIKKTNLQLTAGQRALRLNCLAEFPNINYIAFTSAVTAVGNDKGLTPDTFMLEQNYPNPFNPVTKIKYALPAECDVSIKIYDALGREIKTLVNQTKRAGYYEAEFDASTLPSGIYLYKIQAGLYTCSRKMMLVK